MKRILITILFGFIAAQNTLYCDICTNHIACRNNASFSVKCPSNAKMIELSKDEIEIILDVHNSLRNTIASGLQPGFPEAARMGTMIWNNELAWLAGLNAKQCEMEHDVCRKTTRFMFAGQNLSLNSRSKTFKPIPSFLDDAINAWYREVDFSVASDVNMCCDAESNQDIGHFTQIVRDNSSEVGCAVIQYTSDDSWKNTLIACNYAQTNLRGIPVYVSGETASGCTTGINLQYPGLCSSAEKFDYN